jgi:hypothetical protein
MFATLDLIAAQPELGKFQLTRHQPLDRWCAHRASAQGAPSAT